MKNQSSENKNQSSENKLVITEECIFDQNKLSKDPNNHFKLLKNGVTHLRDKGDIRFLSFSSCTVVV